MADTAKKASRTSSPRSRADVPPGIISVLEIYTVEEAKARLGWTDSALRSAKRKGLTLIACGKRRYVTGREILRFLESLQDDTKI
jgi:hypothetical protein